MDRETVVGDWSMPLEVRLGRQRWIVPVGTSLTIGRDDSSSIPVDHVQVSRHHATVDATAEGWLLVDHSRTGVFLHGRRMPRVLITTPTAVALGHPVDGVVLTLAPVRGGAGPGSAAPSPAARTGVHDPAGPRITVGRLPDNDVVLDDLLVSRHHAVLECVGGTWRVRDAGRANGTYLNGQRVAAAELVEGDLIGIGHASLQLSGNRLVAHEDDGDVDIEAADLVVTRDGRRLLDGLALLLEQQTWVDWHDRLRRSGLDHRLSAGRGPPIGPCSPRTARPPTSRSPTSRRPRASDGHEASCTRPDRRAPASSPCSAVPADRAGRPGRS